MKYIKFPKMSNPIFTTSIPVRIYDLNYGNHLGHDSLISIIHEARVRFFKQMNYSEGNIEGKGILITQLLVVYKSQAFYGDEIGVNIEISDTSRSSVELLYELKNSEKDKEIATALTTCTFYDYKRSKVVRPPKIFLNHIHSVNSGRSK